VISDNNVELASAWFTPKEQRVVMMLSNTSIILTLILGILTWAGTTLDWPRQRWRRTVTQSDAVIKSEKDVTDYHGQLLEQLRHVEDTINKFAIQNYAASGAVVLAYLANKAPHWATTIIVALLNINFAIAILVQFVRVHKLFTMHCIVRNFWLANQPELLKKLQANKTSSGVLTSTTFPLWVAIITVLWQFLPILFVYLLS